MLKVDKSWHGMGLPSDLNITVILFSIYSHLPKQRKAQQLQIQRLVTIRNNQKRLIKQLMKYKSMMKKHQTKQQLNNQQKIQKSIKQKNSLFSRNENLIVI